MGGGYPKDMGGHPNVSCGGGVSAFLPRSDPAVHRLPQELTLTALLIQTRWVSPLTAPQVSKNALVKYLPEQGSTSAHPRTYSS